VTGNPQREEPVVSSQEN